MKTAYMIYLTHVKSFIQRYKWTCLLLILLYCVLHTISYKKILYILAEFSIILLPLVIVAKYRIINFIVPLLLSFIISLELSYFIIFSEPVTPVILGAILQTNAVEAKTALPLLKAFIPLFIISNIVFWGIIKEFKQLPTKKLILCSFILFICFSISLTKLVYKYYTVIPDTEKASAIDLLFFFKEPIKYKYPLFIGNITYIVGDFLEKQYLSAHTHHEAWPEGISVNKQKTNTPTKIVIVLGESSLSDNYSLYGYPFKTTPRLDKLYQDKQIIKFDQVITGIPNTNESIRLTFSYATATNPKPFVQDKNIIEMAKMANYQTIWLSSVIEMGIYGSYAGMIASSSDIFWSPTSKKELVTQEDLTLPPLFKSLYQQDKKQFFIVHLQGSHIPYKSHYDKEDEVLTTTPENTHYDRTIHHTDRLLAKLIDIIKQQDKDAILLYFPDHGEIINKGHGFMKAPIAQYKIPFIIYQHKNTTDPRPLVDKYRTKQGMLNLVNMTYIMTELLGFDIDNALVKQAQKEGEMVLRGDLKPYPFEQLQAESPQHFAD